MAWVVFPKLWALVQLLQLGYFCNRLLKRSGTKRKTRKNPFWLAKSEHDVRFLRLNFVFHYRQALIFAQRFLMFVAVRREIMNFCNKCGAGATKLKCRAAFSCSDMVRRGFFCCGAVGTMIKFDVTQNFFFYSKTGHRRCLVTKNLNCNVVQDFFRKIAGNCLLSGKMIKNWNIFH